MERVILSAVHTHGHAHTTFYLKNSQTLVNEVRNNTLASIRFVFFCVCFFGESLNLTHRLLIPCLWHSKHTLLLIIISRVVYCLMPLLAVLQHSYSIPCVLLLSHLIFPNIDSSVHNVPMSLQQEFKPFSSTQDRSLATSI